MGTGYHGGFGKTRGNKPIPGNATFKSKDYRYFDYIKNRKDVDVNGVFDIVAHGSTNHIQIEHQGNIEKVTSRQLSKIMHKKKGYKYKQPIRLLSCNTGAMPDGFAQNLANKLNTIVYAPTNIVWAYPDGKHVVAPRSKEDYNKPDLSKKGKFIAFYPGGNRKWKK